MKFATTTGVQSGASREGGVVAGWSLVSDGDADGHRVEPPRLLNY